MDLRISGDGVHKVIHGVNKSVLVTDDVAGRPPGAEVRMGGVRAQNRLEARLVGWVAAVAVFQLVHPLETESDGPFGSIDFPTVEILMTRRQACGLEGTIGPFGHAVVRGEPGQESSGII